MQTIEYRHRIGRIFFAACIAVLGIVSSAFSQTDIEKNFSKSNPADLSGSYNVSGLMADSTTYNGTLKLTKWKTVTTQRGGVFQTFKMDYQFGDLKSNGVAVFDGHRLYYASGEGKRDNYYLLLLAKCELSKDVVASIKDYHARNSNAKEGHYYEWEGKVPWYGFISYSTEAFGYYFWIDGTWGHFYTEDNGFPPSNDTGSYELLDLNEKGESKKMSGTQYAGGFSENGSITAESLGENLTITNIRPKYSDYKDKEYYGYGMMTADPVTGDSILVAMMGGPEKTTYGYFDISGKKIVGVWADGGSEGRGTEEWEVPDNVIQKNPGLFK